MVSFYKANISYIKAIFRRFTNSNIIRNSIPKMKYYISKTVGSIILEKFITAMKSLNKQLSNALITTTTRESNKNSAG